MEKKKQIKSSSYSPQLSSSCTQVLPTSATALGALDYDGPPPAVSLAFTPPLAIAYHPPFPPPNQHTSYLRPPLIDWDARLHDNCRQQFHARLERRKLNDPYSKTACRERAHAFDQNMHDACKTTAKVRRSMERSREEHEHQMRERQKYMQKMVDFGLAREQKEKDRVQHAQLIRDWREFIGSQKAWSSCDAQREACNKQLQDGPPPGWKLPPGWTRPPQPSSRR
jgi:hypothetical protein